MFKPYEVIYGKINFSIFSLLSFILPSFHKATRLFQAFNAPFKQAHNKLSTIETTEPKQSKLPFHNNNSTKLPNDCLLKRPEEVLGLLSSQHGSQVSKTVKNRISSSSASDIKNSAELDDDDNNGVDGVKRQTKTENLVKFNRLDNDEKLDTDKEIKHKEYIDAKKHHGDSDKLDHVKVVDGIGKINALINDTAPSISPSKTRPMSKGDAIHSYIKSKQSKTEPVFVVPSNDLSMDNFKTPKKLPLAASTRTLQNKLVQNDRMSSAKTAIAKKSADTNSHNRSSHNTTVDLKKATTKTTNRKNKTIASRNSKSNDQVTTNQNIAMDTVSTNRNSQRGRVSANSCSALSQSINTKSRRNETVSMSTNCVSSLSIKPIVNTGSQKSDIIPSSSTASSKILNDEEFNAVIAGDSDDSDEDDIL